jgi:hypothetical protein
MFNRPCKRFQKSVRLLGLSALILGATGGAAIADGPGLGNLAYSAGEASGQAPIAVLSSTCAGGSSRNNSHVLMHRGYLLVIAAIDSGKPGGGLEVYDFSNPRRPGTPLFRRCDSATNPLREMHSYGLWRNDADGKEYLALPSTKGIQIWNITNPVAPVLTRDLTISGITASDYADGTWWVSWQAPYIYVAGSGNGLYIVNASDPANPAVVKTMAPASLGDFRTNIVEVVGNVMIAGATDTAKGFATFDLSDPLNPVLKAKMGSPVETYNYKLVGRHGDPSRLYVVARGLTVLDISNLGQIGTVYNNGSFIPTTINGKTFPTKVGYLNYQDGFIHGGYSGSYRKIDLRNPTAPAIVKTGVSTVNGADEDFATVLGNVVFLGNDHDDASQSGSAIYAHQAGPDSTPPAVGYITPTSGAANLKTSVRVGVLFTDNVDLRTLNTGTFTVRPLGGAALPGKYTATFHMVNFTPNTAFAAGTTYEVVINGVKDWAGNAMTAAFTSTFTIAGSGNVPPAGCSLGSETIRNVGTSVAFTVTGCTGSGLSYAFDFGDGTPPTTFGASNSASHLYTIPGHHTVIVHVQNGVGSTSASRRQTVINPPTASKPTRATPIVYDDSRTPHRITVVNPDRNSVRSFDVASLDSSTPSEPVAGSWETMVGRSPRTLAVRPGQSGGGDIWVVSQDDPTIRILNGATGAHIGILSLPNGSRPYGIAFDPAGTFAYVTLEGSGKLAKINPNVALNSFGYPTADPIVALLDVGSRPRGLAVSATGSRILVTRFISPTSGGEVREVSAGSFTVVRTTVIANDTDPTHDTESSGRGLVNYLQSITISPDGTRAVVPSKKDNVYRGQFRDGKPLTFENTVRTVVSILDLASNPASDVEFYRRDINNADLANSAVYTSHGDWIFVAHHNNQVSVYDALNYNATNVMELETTGLTPQGLAIKPDNSRLYVWNFMSRTVETYDITQVGLSNSFVKKSSVSAQTSEALPASVLAGKKIFYNSADARMSRDGYVACASCHLEGGADETVFDFTDDGEGLRNTVSLLGRRGMGHGPVHWSANFDEVQDFEHPIRGLFSGTGFMSNSQFNSGTRNTPLGDAKAGASADLDNLAAYVASLTIVPRSPFRNPDGTLTAAGAAGKAVFQSRNCASCHSGRDFTDSASKVLRDVGTLTVASGKRLGGLLPGIDTPTLLGIWNTAPYLHDGSAATLMDVLGNPVHVGSLGAQEKTDLQSYLLQIDDMGRDFDFSGLVVNDAENAGEWSFRADLGPGDYAYGDRAYIWQTMPASMRDALWIRTASDSKLYAGNPVATFTVDKQVDVFLAWDDRLTSKPSWVAGDGWTDTGEEMTLRETGTAVRTLSLFKKTFGAGLIALKPLNSNSVPMYSVIIKATPPGAVPAPPGGLVAVGGDRQVSLSWVASPGALAYTVGRSTVSGSGYVDIASGISTTSFMATGLTNGVPYFFVVKAVNGAGSSGNSNQASATPTCVLPPAPTGLTAVAGAGQATVSWNAVANATGYNVKRGTSSGSNPPTVGSPGSNLFTSTGLTGGVPYFFRVSATNSCGESANSAEVTVTPTGVTTQNALLVANDIDAATSGLQLSPSDVLIRSNLQGLGYTVTAVEDAASSSTDASGKKVVVISRSVGSADVAAKFDTVAVPVILNEGALFQDMRLSASETGTNLAGQTTLVVASPASPLAAGLSGNVVVVDAPASFTVGAPLASADAALKVAGDPNLAAVFGYDAGAALVTGAAPARRVVFFLDDPGNGTAGTAQATNATGWQLFGAAVQWATGTGGALPGTPTSLSATALSGQVNLGWTGSTGASTYRVQRGTSNGGPYSLIATVNGTSYSDTGVSNGTTFYYVVTALNATGESAPSNQAAATPGCTLPAAPSGLVTTAGSGQVTVSWSAVASANSYKVKRSTTSGGGYSVIASGVTTSAYVNTGLSNGTAYFFVVSSVNACGESSNSSQVAGTPGTTPAPPSSKIAGLVVNDTANASSWAVKSNFQIGSAAPGAHPWPDYASTYLSVWNSNLNALLGKEWIQTRSASKNYTGNALQATISLAATANVYLVVDDRWGTSPSWLSGWTDTTFNVTVREAGSTNRTFSVWKKSNQSGSVGLPRIGSNSAFNYFAIVE